MTAAQNGALSEPVSDPNVGQDTGNNKKAEKKLSAAEKRKLRAKAKRAEHRAVRCELDLANCEPHACVNWRILAESGC